MSTSNPDSLRCPKELELQSASGNDLQAVGSPEMGVPVTAIMVAPCVRSEPEKDTQSQAMATSTAIKHAVPWPHVEPWRKNVALAGYAPRTDVTLEYLCHY